MGWGEGMSGYAGSMWGIPIMGFLVMLALLAVVVWVIVAVARSAWGGRNARLPRGGSDSALDVLRERYARGEIDHDTYERMRRELERAGS